MCVASYPVLRTEKGDQLHVRGIEEHVDRGVEVPVHSGGIGHKSYPLAPHLLETVLLQYVDTGFYMLRRKIAERGGQQ